MKINLTFITLILPLSIGISFISCEETPSPEPFPWTHFYEPLSCEDPWDGNPGGELQAAVNFYEAEGIEILEIKFDVTPAPGTIFVTDQGCFLYPDDTKGLDIRVSEIHGNIIMDLNHGWQAY